jgi:hypothetical protein
MELAVVESFWEAIWRNFYQLENITPIKQQ